MKMEGAAILLKKAGSQAPSLYVRSGGLLPRLHPLADGRHDGDAGVEGRKCGHLHRPAPAAQPRALCHERRDELHQHHVHQDACRGRGRAMRGGECW